MAACVFGEAGGGERREHHGPRLLGGQAARNGAGGSPCLRALILFVGTGITRWLHE